MPATKRKTPTKPKPKSTTGFTANQERQLAAMASALATRASLATQLGQSYGGDRDLYTALGWTKDPTFDTYFSRYDRQDIAKAIIDAPVKACWRMPPEISESDDDETEFEKAWAGILEQHRIWHYFSRVDRLASIGKYAVLLIGFDDAEELSQEVTTASRVLYLMPYSEQSAVVNTWVDDTKDERYGLPLTYQIAMSTGPAGTSRSHTVHWSRVIHVAEDMLDSNFEGTPRLKAVLNVLQNLELVAGSSGEMFWRGAFPGMAFIKDKDATWGKQDLAALKDEIEDYEHKLKRYMRLTGMTIEEIKQQIVDPSKQVAVFIDLIAGTTRIPKRILIGSERGELSSIQDDKHWAEHIDGRRKEHCEPTIIRPFVDRLITVKVLPKPKDGYAVNWPDLTSPSNKERAEVGETVAKALKAYTEGLGSDQLLAHEVFLDTLPLTDSQREKNDALLKDMAKDANANEEPEEE